VDATELQSKTHLPPFLQIVREVTNEKEFETWFMANKAYKMPQADYEELIRNQNSDSDSGEEKKQ
jgi:hypothetical protein